MKHLFLVLLSMFFLNSHSHSETAWFELLSGTNEDLNNIRFVDDLTGYIVGNNKTILKTTNAGNNWVLLDVGSINNQHFYSVFFNNPDTVFVVGSNGIYLKSTNGGINWSSPAWFGVTDVRSILFVSAVVGFTCGSGGIHKSVNKGNSWTFTNFGNVYLKSLFFTNTNTGFVVGYEQTSNYPGKIYKTTNSGVQWLNIVAPPSTPPLTCVKFVNESIGYIATEQGKVLKTTNSGTDWTALTILGITDDFWSLEFIDANTGFLVGEGSTIVKTIDGGISWEPLISPSSMTLNDVHFVNENTGYAVGYGGRIIKTTNGSTSFNGIRLNVKSINEGLYFPLFNSLSRKDTVKAYLQSSSFPYSLVDSAKAVIDSSSFSGILTFNNAPSGTYYIVMKHFQSIETWSKPGGEVLINNGSIYNYDFTTSSSQAYGNNLKLKGSKYCIYTGDLNQSGFIDATELSMVENDAANFITGRFVLTDLNGDEIVDASDYLIVDNNAYNFVGVIRP